MADDCGVVRQPDVLCVVCSSIGAAATCAARRRDVLINYEGALYIDLDGSRMDDGAINLSGVGSHTKGFGARGGAAGRRRGVVRIG